MAWLFAALALVCWALALLPGTAYASESDETGASLWEYTLNDDGDAIITGYTGTETDIVIPATVDGYKVVQINGLGERALPLRR